MKYLMTFENMVHTKSLEQLRRVSKELNKIDIGKRVSDSSFANALNTKKDITDTNIQSYSDYLKEPFTVNQNIMPWKDRKKK